MHFSKLFLIFNSIYDIRQCLFNVAIIFETTTHNNYHLLEIPNVNKTYIKQLLFKVQS